LCRQLYTVALEQCVTLWKQRGVAITRSQQEAELKTLRAEMPESAALHRHVLQDVLARLEKSYQAFFLRRQRGARAGFPRFKGRARFPRCTSKQCGNGARLDTGFLVLSTMGRVAVRWSRPLAGTPKTVTVSREADGWEVAISCAEVPSRPLPRTGVATGRDRGRESFATLATGEPSANPRSLRVAPRRRRRAPRRVSRRKRGSRRRRKAVRRLARAQQRVRRARTDCHHTTARSLVRQFDTISHEDLQPAHLLKHHHLAKSSADAGWRAFLGIRSCKAAAAGKAVVAVPPASTSQACSGCGVLVHTGLSVRWHACPDCGTSLHRDQNAARTIWRVGREHSGAGQALQARTWAGGPSVA
jgi:putative transposase